MDVQTKEILLVEEEQLLAEITAFRLELLGFRVTVIRSAEIAIERAASSPPAAVLVGQFVEGMEGMELLNRLSNDVRTGNLPTMFVSTHADLDDVVKAFRAGADEYLVTPFDPLVLEQKVNRLVGIES